MERKREEKEKEGAIWPDLIRQMRACVCVCVCVFVSRGLYMSQQDAAVARPGFGRCLCAPTAAAAPPCFHGLHFTHRRPGVGPQRAAEPD